MTKGEWAALWFVIAVMAAVVGTITRYKYWELRSKSDDNSCEVKCLKIDQEILVRKDDVCYCDNGVSMKLR